MKADMHGPIETVPTVSLKTPELNGCQELHFKWYY